MSSDFEIQSLIINSGDVFVNVEVISKHNPSGKNANFMAKFTMNMIKDMPFSEFITLIDKKAQEAFARLE